MVLFVNAFQTFKGDEAFSGVIVYGFGRGEDAKLIAYSTNNYFPALGYWAWQDWPIPDGVTVKPTNAADQWS